MLQYKWEKNVHTLISAGTVSTFTIRAKGTLKILFNYKELKMRKIILNYPEKTQS